jgi:hypothetical protein
MAALGQIRARIGAARLILEQHAGQPPFAAMSAVQSTALASVLQSAKGTITAEDAADLMTKVTDIKWACDEDAAAVFQELVPKKQEEMEPSSKRRRRDLQDFEQWHVFGDEAFWQQVQQPGVPMQAKLIHICQRCLSLGLRLPTEHTLKWITAVWISFSHSAEAQVSMDGGQKATYLKHAKKVFDNLRRHAPDPQVWMQKLPDDPLEYLRDYPNMYHVVFRCGIKPCQPPFDIMGAQALNQSFGCRGGPGRSFSMTAAAPSTGPRPLELQLSPRRGEASALERVASNMMAQMQHMAQAQNRLIELVLGGSLQPARAPRAIASLIGVDAMSLPCIEDRPRQPLAMPVSIVEEPETPTSSARESPAMVKAGSSSQLTSARIETAQNATGASDELEDLLTALHDRKEAKKEAAKIAAEDNALAAASSTPKPKSKGNCPTSKATSKAIPTSESKAESKSTPMPKSKAKSKSTPTPKSKAKGKSTQTPKSKGKGNALFEKAMQKALDHGLVLGCPKCRFSVRGCSTCHQLDYAGKRWNLNASP